VATKYQVGFRRWRRWKEKVVCEGKEEGAERKEVGSKVEMIL